MLWKKGRNKEMNLDLFFLPACLFPSCLHRAMFWLSQSDEQVFPFHHCWILSAPLWLILHPVIMLRRKQTLILFNCQSSKKKYLTLGSDITHTSHNGSPLWDKDGKKGFSSSLSFVDINSDYLRRRIQICVGVFFLDMVHFNENNMINKV